MSKEKAKEFLQYLKDNPETLEKMKGFTQEHLKDAVEDLKNEKGYEGVAGPLVYAP